MSHNWSWMIMKETPRSVLWTGVTGPATSGSGPSSATHSAAAAWPAQPSAHCPAATRRGTGTMLGAHWACTIHSGSRREYFLFSNNEWESQAGAIRLLLRPIRRAHSIEEQRSEPILFLAPPQHHQVPTMIPSTAAPTSAQPACGGPVVVPTCGADLLQPAGASACPFLFRHDGLVGIGPLLQPSLGVVFSWNSECSSATDSLYLQDAVLISHSWSIFFVKPF
jgi:hypothetical protein